MPCVAVLFEASAAQLSTTVGIDANAWVGPGPDSADGNDVPGFVGRNVRSDEVDVFGGVGRVLRSSASKTGVDHETVASIAEGSLHLDAQHAFAGSQDEIEWQTVAVRFRDCEPEAGGFENEEQFPELSFLFGDATLAERGCTRCG